MAEVCLGSSAAGVYLFDVRMRKLGVQRQVWVVGLTPCTGGSVCGGLSGSWVGVGWKSEGGWVRGEMAMKRERPSVGKRRVAVLAMKCKSAGVVGTRDELKEH